MSGRYVPRPRALAQLREATAYGMHNFGLAVQTASMAHTPVRGGFRSFNLDQPVGGTLRRSHFTATFLDGRQIAGPAIDPPDGMPTTGMVTIVGTNAGYGFWVHEGTRKMDARPFMTEGFLEEKPNAEALVAAGAHRRLGQ